VAASPGAILPCRPTGDGRIDAHPPDGGAQALRRPSLLVGTIGTVVPKRMNPGLVGTRGSG
jgi:hypothetical protein